MIQFNEADHSYTQDGIRYPSVTTILAAMGFYGDATKYFTEYSRDRGSYVHKIIQFHLQGELDPESIDPALEGYFKAWLKFEADTNYRPILNEAPMFTDLWKFAGTPDHIGLMYFKDPEVIIDVKSGADGHAAAIQTAGYQILYPKAKRRFSLQLRQDGKYKLTEYRDREDRGIFLSALAVYQWQVNKKLRGGK